MTLAFLSSPPLFLSSPATSVLFLPFGSFVFSFMAPKLNLCLTQWVPSCHFPKIKRTGIFTDKETNVERLSTCPNSHCQRGRIRVQSGVFLITAPQQLPSHLSSPPSLPPLVFSQRETTRGGWREFLDAQQALCLSTITSELVTVSGDKGCIPSYHLPVFSSSALEASWFGEIGALFSISRMSQRANRCT